MGGMAAALALPLLQQAQPHPPSLAATLYESRDGFASGMAHLPRTHHQRPLVRFLRRCHVRSESRSCAKRAFSRASGPASSPYLASAQQRRAALHSSRITCRFCSAAEIRALMSAFFFLPCFFPALTRVEEAVQGRQSCQTTACAHRPALSPPFGASAL
jgi:hypothetical protein